MNSIPRPLQLIVVLLLIEFGIIPHRKAGYYCHDPKYAFQFQGDTVSISVLLVTAYFLPLLILACTEWKRSQGCFRTLANRVWFWYKDFLLGITTMLVLIEFVKVIVGEPRPHFFDTCRPDSELNCTEGTYVSTYTCTNKVDRSWLVHDSSKSFPSGHAAMGIYAALFSIWYLQQCLPRSSYRLLRPSAQTILIVLSAWCALSRISDNRHHWWDVLAGTTLGIIYAVYTITVSCKNFKRRLNGPPRAAQNEPVW